MGEWKLTRVSRLIQRDSAVLLACLATNLLNLLIYAWLTRESSWKF